MRRQSLVEAGRSAKVFLLGHLVVVFLLMGGIAAVVGFRGGGDFGGNLLAEAVGMLVRAVLTLTLITVFEEERQRQRSAQVESAVLGAALNAFCDIAIQLYLVVLRKHQVNEISKLGKPGETPSPFAPSAVAFVMGGRQKPSQAGVATLDAISVELWKWKDVAVGDREYRAARPHFDELRSLTHRMLDLAQEAEFVRLLMEIETSDRAWAAQVRVGEETGWTPPDLTPAWSVCRNIRDAYDYLLHHWPAANKETNGI